MIWFLLLLSLINPLIAMGTDKDKKKKLFTYSLPNLLRRSDPDKPNFPVFDVQATPMQFEQIKYMSDTFATHVQRESVDLEAEVQHTFNKIQLTAHGKKPSLSDDDIAKQLQSQIDDCKTKLNYELLKLKIIEKSSDDKKDLELDYIERKIKSLSHELMMLSHTQQLHNIHINKKRIETVIRQRMKVRLQPLFADLDAAVTKQAAEKSKITP